MGCVGRGGDRGHIDVLLASPPAPAAGLATAAASAGPLPPTLPLPAARRCPHFPLRASWTSVLGSILAVGVMPAVLSCIRRAAATSPASPLWPSLVAASVSPRRATVWRPPAFLCQLDNFCGDPTDGMA